MPTPTTEHDPAEPRVVTDVTCAGCGCLCDDIVATAAGGQVIEAKNACPLGQTWFAQPRAGADKPAALVDGQPASLSEALTRAAEVLCAARAPLVLGLSRTTLEAQAIAAAIADHIGAIIDPAHSADAAPRWSAIQRAGIVSATLGEVKNRADVVVFWGVDPVSTHPRHFERYSVDPRGRFVPEGRVGRFVLVADQTRTATAQLADLFLNVPAEKEFEVLWALRAIVSGVALDKVRVERSCGVEYDALRSFATRLQSARYGAFFFGSGLGRVRGGAANFEAALLLVRALNATTRFVALGLGEPGNAAGAEAVLGWQTGFPLAVDFRRGFPRYQPGEASAEQTLASGAADAALVVGEVDELGLSDAARARLRSLPIVTIGPHATKSFVSAAVVVHTAISGLEAPGTYLRCDGVTLPLRPVLSTNLPSDVTALKALARALEAQPAI